MVGCKWIYKIKTCSNGSIKHYKSCLVVEGFTQEYGIDYEETFTSVARISSVHALLAVAIANKWDHFQIDVKNAFLNGDLSEEVYMQPPPGLSVESNKICHFNMHFMALNKLHNLGFTNSTLSSFTWVTWPVIMILSYFFVALTKTLFYFSYMWMI